MTYNEVLETLPRGAVWSASFGYPGEGGYSECWREPDGTRHWISNGTWMDFAPFAWTVKTMAPMPAPA